MAVYLQFYLPNAFTTGTRKERRMIARLLLSIASVIAFVQAIGHGCFSVAFHLLVLGYLKNLLPWIRLLATIGVSVRY